MIYAEEDLRLVHWNVQPFLGFFSPERKIKTLGFSVENSFVMSKAELEPRVRTQVSFYMSADSWNVQLTFVEST